MNIGKMAKRVIKLQNDMIINHRYIVKSTASDYIAAHECPQLTREEKREIDAFWKRFGVRFNNYDYFRMYYYVTGKKDPRFIPEPFMEQVIYPYYNDQIRNLAYVDKSKFPTFLPDMMFPKALVYRMNGHFHNNEGHYIGESVSTSMIAHINALIEAEGNRDIIIKETTDTSFGLGVKKYRIDSEKQLFDVLQSIESKNYVLQIAVKQHSFFAQFNPDSVNIIRINSWRHGSEVDILSSAVRFGITGSHTDVAFRQGKEIINCVGIQNDGCIKKTGIGLDGELIELDVTERQIPHWDEIVALVRKNHLEMDFFDYIAWDITVDTNGTIICIEYNLNQPGSVVYQFANGPLAGEKTDAFLSFLNDSNNQKKWIPYCIRAKRIFI